MLKTSALVFAGVMLGSLSFGAWAFPVAPVDANASRNIILAADGCGRGEHFERGRCRPNREVHRVCPHGWHFNIVLDRCVR